MLGFKLTVEYISYRICRRVGADCCLPHASSKEHCLCGEETSLRRYHSLLQHCVMHCLDHKTTFAAGADRQPSAAGANPNLLDFNGASPLHLAVELQDDQVLAALLAGGANPDQFNKDVTSALHATAQRGPIKLMQLLLQHNAGNTIRC